MKFPNRSRQSPPLPGITGTAKVERRAGRLLPRLRTGDVAVIDHVDLDRATAQGLVDSGVVAVVNAAPMFSGRYPNLGPKVLVDAGVLVLDRVEGAARVKDGQTVRLDGETVHLEDGTTLSGRVLDAGLVVEEMDGARSGLASQLEAFTHNSTEFLRREQDLLLHGEGVPALPAKLAGRPAVVVVRSHDWESELRGLRPFLREQRPVVIAVDRGADALRDKGVAPDVVVLSSTAADLPSADVLRKTPTVVLLTERGAARSVSEPLERLGVQAVHFETTATAEDAALLLADAADSGLVVGVGMHATLDEFLDRQRPGLASTFLTRLKLGPRLVDAAAVPTLYDGAVRPRHVAALSAFGALLLAVAVSVTPVGQEWLHEIGPWAGDIYDNIRGLFA